MELAVAARPLRGCAVALPWPTATDGPSSKSTTVLACPAVPPPATRSSPAGARGAVAHPGPRGGRPAAPCPLSQEEGRCRGALKFCSFLHLLSAFPATSPKSAFRNRSVMTLRNRSVMTLRNRSVMTLRNRSVMKKHTLTHSFRARVTKRRTLRPSYHPDCVSP